MLVIYLKQPQKCFVKWAILGVFSIYFRPFKQTLQFLQQIYVKIFMTIQYTAPGFQPTTFGTQVSSHNHKTRAPALSTRKVLQE